jgi:outer membrane protein assembly factor BamB
MDPSGKSPGIYRKWLMLLLAAGMIHSCTLAPLQAQDQSWTRFRGPNGSGLAGGDAHPPVEFGENKHLLWKVEIPEGVSSPLVWGDRIYLTACNRDSAEMLLLCLDRSDGSLIWTRSFFPGEMESVHSISSPAQSTPAVDREGIYVYYASYGVLCYDHEGKVRWKTPLNKVQHRWGHAASPVIMDDLVIMNHDFGGPDVRKLLALNKHNGELVWETLVQKESYLEDSGFLTNSAPVRFEDQIIIHRYGGVAAYSLADGSPIWWMPIASEGVSTPILLDSVIYVSLWNNISDKEDHGAYFEYEDFEKVIREFDRDADRMLSLDEVPEDLIITRRREVGDFEGASHSLRSLYGYHDTDRNNEVDSLEWSNAFAFFSKYVLDLGLSALRTDHHGAISPEAFLWTQTATLSEVPSPIAVNGYIYNVRDGGWVSCTDPATGELVFSEKLGTTGGYFASPVAARGYLYIAGHRGIVHVIKAATRPEVISEARLEGKIVATPAIAGNAIYFRTSNYLYAFGDSHTLSSSTDRLTD